ncbi:MAG: lytic transglycosylase domain-containing protein [Chromatiales bacterium]|nr:lytic transglycosylase domain-containing protein [Chromatiales bacterium]
MLGLLPALLHFYPSNVVAAERVKVVDSELKQRLITALAIDDKVKDRFDMSVWVTDMEARLKPYINDSSNRLKLLKHVYQESRRVDIPPELVLAVIHIESNFDRFAISRVGARGLMQIMPFWLNEIGRPEDNLFSIATNLRFGCTILRHYIDKENGDIATALARYNGSIGKRKYPDKIFAKLRRYWYRS